MRITTSKLKAVLIFVGALALMGATTMINLATQTTGILPHASLPTLLSGDIPNNAANTSGTAANLSGTPTLPNGTKATTQASGSADTNLATNAYVDGFVSSSMTGRVSGADVTCGTGGTISSCTTAQTVTGLSFALPAVAKTWSFECHMVVSQATAATANQWLIQTATNGATNMTAFGTLRLAAASAVFPITTGQGSTTTGVELGGITWTLAATATKNMHDFYGTIEGASASGSTLNIQVIAPTVADLLTIYRGSWCRVF